VSNKIYPVVTARCYAEQGIATASRLSVRLSVTLRYRDHIGWNSSKMISRLELYVVFALHRLDWAIFYTSPPTRTHHHCLL